MAIVDSFEECPQCNQPRLYCSFNCRNLEEYKFCMICGFRAWTTLVIDRITKRPKVTKNGKWTHRYYERMGFGIFRVKYDNDSGALGNFKAPLTDDQVAECIQDWENFPSGTLVFLTRWTDHLEILIGSIEEQKHE